MDENRTLITFFESNASFEYKVELKGFSGKEMLGIVGLLELCKAELLKDINEDSEGWEG